MHKKGGKKMKSFGGIVFIIGLILAAVIAIFSAATAPPWAVFLLALIGLIVGLLNITEKEVQFFLVASVAFLISFTALSNVFTVLTLGWEGVAAFFGLMNIFVAPATAIVAIKAIYSMAKD
jgi:hypothetical membrane protein